LYPLAPGAKVPPRAARFKQAAAVAAVVFVLAALALLPPYFFQGWLDWLKGARWQMNKGNYGHPAFFLGEYSHDGWRTYFPIAFLLKTPLPSVVLIAASLLLFRAGTPLRLREALFLLVPVAAFLALMIPAKINIGVRYLTPIYPFLFVCAARLATLSFPRPWLAPVLLGVPVLLTAVSSLWSAPHQLAYFNELVLKWGENGPEKRGDLYLADTNIDWGQDLKGLKEYVDREGLPMVYLSYFGTAPPEAYGIDFQELPSFGAVDWPPRLVRRVPRDAGRQVVAISVTNLQGAYLGEPGPYRGFYKERTPRAKIGYSIWIYDITGDSEAHRWLAEAYRYAARRERDKARHEEQAGRSGDAAMLKKVAVQWDELAAEE
jgi:hypothetical protein